MLSIRFLGLALCAALLSACGGGGSSDGDSDGNKHSVTPEIKSAMTTALSSGDAKQVEIVNLLAAAREEIENLRDGESLLEALYKKESMHMTREVVLS